MSEAAKAMTIAVIGNPNSGKTTLFNALTGSTQRVGNWPGVTVEKKVGSFTHNGDSVTVVDLPGIYALSASSEDERVSLEYILSGDMDLILNIIDGTNLERNLFLTLQLAEMNVPMLVAVNMLDIAKQRKITIDLASLSSAIGCPVYGLTATNKGDAELIKQKIVDMIAARPVPSIRVPYPLEIEQWIDANAADFSNTAAQYKLSTRWVALQLLEQNNLVLKATEANGEFSSHMLAESILQLDFADSPEVLIAESRYQHIHDIANAATKAPEKRTTTSDKIDSIVLNRLLGIPLFLIMMYLVFWSTITIGGSFIDFFDIAVGAVFVDGLGQLLNGIAAPAWLITLLASGIGAGIQTVSTFVPIVFVMFLCLSILEDSGYMARAAFVMDRFMLAIGLPGKSFVPMLVGFGCSVPAIMATRTLDSTRDRIMTVFMTPFMSCGARLPVYALFGAAFFGANAGLMVFSIYLAGGLLAVLTGLLMKNTLLHGTPSYFILELPPYHAPKPLSILRHAWNRTKSFVIRSGKVITISVALLGFLNSIGTDGSFGNEDAKKSVLSAAGMAITPIFEPMGIEEGNWPATVALFTGLFAKEAIVGTLNGLYSQIDNNGTDILEEESFHLAASLKEALQTIPVNLLSAIELDKDATADEFSEDDPIFTSMHTRFTHGPIQVYAYLLFVLLYVPCIAAMGAVVREIGAKLAVILAAYLTLIAWIVSTLVYQIGAGHQALWVATPLALLVLIAFLLRLLGKSHVRKASSI